MHSAGSTAFPVLLQLIALAGAALASGLALPMWRKLCLRGGLVDDPGQRKIHTEPIALAGGFALLTGVLLPLVAGWAWFRFGPWPPDLARALPPESPHPHPLLSVLAGAIGMTLLGWVDDRWELRPAAKFAGQVLVGSAAVGAGVQTSAGDLPPGLGPVLSLFWILTVVNAVNFIDNMDGLCAGLGTITACALGLTLHTGGQALLATLAFLTAGAALGVLPWNFPKATAFLGDAGSHGIGFLLAALSLLADFDSGRDVRFWEILGPVLMLGVPLIDLVWVVIVRWRAGRPFYVGDTNHLSHQLVRLGCTRVQAVGILWAWAAALSGVALLL